MLVTVLLFCSAGIVASALADQILVCLTGRGPWTKRSVAWARGSERISSWRWMGLGAATLLWTLLGLSTEEPEWPIVVINGVFFFACNIMLVIMLLFPPPRSRIERGFMTCLVGVTPLAILVVATSRDVLVAHPEVTRFFPFLATLGFASLGRVHQIWTLVVSKSVGKLTVSDPVICTIDCTLWVLYGLTTGRWEIWFPCVVVGLLDAYRLSLVLHYRKNSKPLSSSESLGNR